ncbi:MAG: hypothetical protein RI909_1585 [Bacteroidota bacterium]|jgi:hypothetical protein
MNFEEYLISKKIDSQAFRAAEPALWNEWNGLFEAMSPASFTAQKLYLINPLRRKYVMKVAEVATAPKVSAPAAARPVMKPKLKID